MGGSSTIRRLRGRVLVVGAGGLGAPLTEVLARSGVERLTIADFDRVDLTNLQRQVLFTTPDVGRPKAVVAAERLRAIAPGIDVTPVEVRVDASNARDVLSGHAVVCDGTDSLKAKFLLNDTCVALGIPFIMGGILRFEGQVMTVLPGMGACYRCLFEEPPPDGAVPTCAQAGVLGAMAGTIGAVQAGEAVRILSGEPPELASALLVLDALAGRSRRIPVPRNPDCRACGRGRAN